MTIDVRRVAAVLVISLMLGACTREEATARLKADLPAGYVHIIHARFPCHSADLHFFGYRFRFTLEGEIGEGDVCWTLSTGQWAWQIRPEYSLSRLNRR